jgi:hypothetical protein
MPYAKHHLVRPALSPMCAFGVFVLASFCVAWLCFGGACVCDRTPFCFRLAGLFFRLSPCKIYLPISPNTAVERHEHDAVIHAFFFTATFVIVSG